MIRGVNFLAIDDELLLYVFNVITYCRELFPEILELWPSSMLLVSRYLC